jgi:hypothetical protein
MDQQNEGGGAGRATHNHNAEEVWARRRLAVMAGSLTAEVAQTRESLGGHPHGLPGLRLQANGEPEVSRFCIL